jgi:hypothetical protein
VTRKCRAQRGKLMDTAWDYAQHWPGLQYLHTTAAPNIPTVNFAELHQRVGFARGRTGHPSHSTDWSGTSLTTRAWPEPSGASGRAEGPDLRVDAQRSSGPVLRVRRPLPRRQGKFCLCPLLHQLSAADESDSLKQGGQSGSGMSAGLRHLPCILVSTVATLNCHSGLYSCLS